ALAGADEEGYSVPARRVQEESDGRIRLDGRIRRDAGLRTLPAEVTPPPPRLFVESAPTGDAEGLGHRDLHARDGAAIPEGLRVRGAEAEQRHVLDGELARVVIEPTDRGLVEHAVDDGVELARRGQVVTERLLDQEPAALDAAGGTQAADDARIRARGDRQVEERADPAAEDGGQRLVRRWVAVVAGHDLETAGENPQSRVVRAAAIRLGALPGAREQHFLATPLPRDEHHRHVQLAELRHALERREDLLEGQIAGGAEEDQGIRAACRVRGVGHERADNLGLSYAARAL